MSIIENYASRGFVFSSVSPSDAARLRPPLFTSRRRSTRMARATE